MAALVGAVTAVVVLAAAVLGARAVERRRPHRLADGRWILVVRDTQDRYGVHIGAVGAKPAPLIGETTIGWAWVPGPEGCSFTLGPVGSPGQVVLLPD